MTSVATDSGSLSIGSSTSQTPSGSSLSSLSFSASSPVSGTDSASPSATNAPSQPTSTIQPTSATPTSSPSPTPVTTAQSSPAQTTSAAAQTTPSSQSDTSSSNASPTTSPLASSTISFTSQVATTFSSTNPAGSVVLITSTVPEVVTTSISLNTGTTTTSHSTGIIVGAVVGGVIGVALVALLLFCIRKRARKDEFDGNFDPDRVVGHADVGGGTLPHIDLADEVTPFPPSQPFTDQRSSSMRQYGQTPYIPVSSSPGPSGHPSAEFYPHGTVGAGPSVIDGQPRSPPANMYGTGPVDWYSPRPGASPPPSTVSNTTSSTRAAKEREAMGRGGQGRGLTLGTPQEAAEGSGDVVVHQDAGRAPIEEHAPPREIPPAYESIRQD
ncbi:hypothetical protein JVT61DRAFT_14758 [Boletus reticuloceps]|uniref:Uncharacterized protein n=1 Tax=Boletus reticuloceps TaxID=495285 RepID=A0A8I2YRG9_9AGAM|nr:hypothetical protein JVT61DRAFT_14758 [Boletus reticuloceps]